MSAWRAKALEMLPELAKEIAAVDNPIWCLEYGHRDSDAARDLPTCVVVGFYEDIPNHKASREDMPHWFT